MTSLNDFGQPVGEPLRDWQVPALPSSIGIRGDHVELAPFDRLAHAGPLMVAFADAPDSLWTYMTFGPFQKSDDMAETIDTMLATPGWQPYVILVDGNPVGFASYLRIDPSGGVLEIGAITFSPQLQRTAAATEALFLMIDHAFELGYRRCEWKCDELNGPSRAAAERLGFRYEGTFRQATHYKGRNRDTAWYAITDRDWPPLANAFRSWLAPSNFDAQGRQLTRLGDLRS